MRLGKRHSLKKTTAPSPRYGKADSDIKEKATKCDSHKDGKNGHDRN